MEKPKRRLYIKTYGCQMNVYDSARMAELLSPEYTLTEVPEEADLYLINTCSIRRKSEEKVRSLLGRLRPLKRRRPQMRLGVCGCVAQQEGARLLAQAPHLDLVLGTQAIFRLPEGLRQRDRTGRPVLDTRLDPPDPPEIPVRRVGPPAPALVTIMTGCDNYCTYCVVPYVRGRERSRPADDIVAEVSALVAAGAQDVTLLGQNVNSYGRGLADGLTFPELLRRLAGIPGLARLRFTTSHPRDLSEELIACFADLPVLCPHLHLPAQSGSDAVLSRMHRGYTRAAYLDQVRRLRQARPDMAISTDLIVGFPGETDQDFADTLDLMRQADFASAFSFKYSPRPQTLAAGFPDQVPEPVKTRRLAVLQAQQEELSLASNQRLVGGIHDVLVEGRSKQSGDQLCGRLRSNQVVNFTGPERLRGSLVPVRIETAHPHSLGGSLAVPVNP